MDDISIVFLATMNQIDMLDRAASRYQHVKLRAYNLAAMDLPAIEEEVIRGGSPDILFMTFPSLQYFDDFKESISRMKGDSKIVAVGKDIQIWKLNTVPMDVAKTVYEYTSNSGQENYDRLLDYLLIKLCGADIEERPPIEVPMHGLVNPKDLEHVYPDLESYKEAYGWDESKPAAALTITRESWVARNVELRACLFECLEKAGFNAVAVMSKPKDDPALNALGLNNTFYQLLVKDDKPLIDAFVINHYMIRDTVRTPEGNIELDELIRRMNIPIFCPMELKGMTQEDWEASSGIGILEATRIVVPEMQGFIEPIVMGVRRNSGTESDYVPV